MEQIEEEEVKMKVQKEVVMTQMVVWLEEETRDLVEVGMKLKSLAVLFDLHQAGKVEGKEMKIGVAVTWYQRVVMK